MAVTVHMTIFNDIGNSVKISCIDQWCRIWFWRYFMWGTTVSSRRGWFLDFKEENCWDYRFKVYLHMRVI
jgi:hypothetical protein